MTTINTFILNVNMSDSTGVYTYPIISDDDGVDRRYKWGDRPAIVRAAAEAAKLSQKHNTSVQVWTLGANENPFDWRGRCIRHVLTLKDKYITFMKRTVVRSHQKEYNAAVINDRDIELMQLDGIKLP